MFDQETARREVRERNRVRAEAHLPLLPVEVEVRRLEKVASQKARDDFVLHSPLRERVEAKLLARERRRRGDPTWVPTGVLSGGGLAFSVQVHEVMLRFWRGLNKSYSGASSGT
jgi:hypothetical protein